MQLDAAAKRSNVDFDSINVNGGGSGDGTAVTDSCYRDPGATDLDDINDVALPSARD